MQTRRIGSLEVSIVGLGTNNFGGRLDEEKASEVLNAALDAGINFIDTADVYGQAMSETIIGKTLRSRRDEVVLATKFGFPSGPQGGGGAAPHVAKALDSSLGRLQTDHIDLYIYHRRDPNVPLEETLGALDEARRAGKVREAGISNLTAEAFDEAASVSVGDTRFVNLQNEFSILKRDVEAEILPLCVKEGIGFVPYYPLAGGMLTGKYRLGAALPEQARLTRMSEAERARFIDDERLRQVDALEAVAERHGRPIANLAIAWLFTRPGVASVIAGAMSPDQVASNVAAASFELTAADLADIDTIAPAG